MSCLVGITCGWRESEMRHLLHDEYIKAVYNAGGVPFLIPTVEPSLAEKYYQMFDGLIFSGGDDVDPLFFGQEPLEVLGEITPVRDRFELVLAKTALQGNKPVLGICRGIQVLNIAAGGTVYQDINGQTKQQHRQRAPRWYPTHQVEIDKDSRLFKMMGTNQIRVNSFHHQAVNLVGAPLKAVAWSKDGLIEAIEIKDTSRFIIGVQWHPECSYHQDEFSTMIFSSFIEKCSVRK